MGVLLALSVVPIAYSTFWFIVGLVYCGKENALWMFNTFANSEFMLLASCVDFTLNFTYWYYHYCWLGYPYYETLLDNAFHVCVFLEWLVACMWLLFCAWDDQAAIGKMTVADLKSGDHLERRGAFGFKGLTHHAIFIVDGPENIE